MTSNPERTQTIEMLLGIAGTLLIVLALSIYILNEPGRIETTQGEILASQLDEAMTLYAENCSICHGMAGEGIGAIPALDTEGMRTMPSDELTRIIAEGRYNTSMPAWSQDNGGPLSDFQVSELVAQVQYGDWQQTQDRVVNLGLAPLVPFTTEPDADLFSAVALLPDGGVLQHALSIYADQCVACHGADGLGTSIAPALNAPLVSVKTVEELTRVITFGTAGTLMAGWSTVLPTEDIASLVSLIQRWEEIPQGTIPSPDEPVPVTAESLILGADLFASNCSRCHGPEGQGTQRGPALNVQSFLSGTNDVAIQQIITLGVPGTSMPAWGDKLSEAYIQAIVGFIRQWEPTAPEVAVPVRIGRGGPPWMSSGSLSTGDATAVPQATHQADVTPGAQATLMASTRTPGGGAGDGSGQGGPSWAAEGGTGSKTDAISYDWRIITAAASLVVISLALIIWGYTMLKRKKPGEDTIT